MWLLKALHSRPTTGLLVKSVVPYYHVIKCIGNFMPILQNVNCFHHYCPSSLKADHMPTLKMQSHSSPGIISHIGRPAHLLQFRPASSIQTIQKTAYSTSIKRKGVRILAMEHKPIENAGLACIHSGMCMRDIPDYLQGNISEVSNLEDDLDDDWEDEWDTDMEEKISDFFDARLISFEETESSFMLPCYTCSAENKSRSQEIFVDKSSGYFVCPWCCQSGTWEELKRIIDSREDSITSSQLSLYLSTTVDVAIAAVDLSIIQESPLQAVSLTTLQDCEAKTTSDGTRLVIPLKSDNGAIVGFESISLLHPVPQVVRRYVAGEAQPLFVAEKLKNHPRIVIVPSLCDVLTLAEYDVAAVSFSPDYLDVLSNYLTETNKQEVFLWLGLMSPPRQMIQHLINSNIPCWIVGHEDKKSPIHTMSLKEVQVALKNGVSVLSEATTTFPELKDQIYHRLTNKEETCGVQWKRFSGLNSILLGHRPGEMTVLTGPTGSGKTTLMAEYSMDLCSQGVVTLWGSFEISVVRLCEVMLQQYNGTSLPVDFSDFNVLASKFSALPLHFLTYHGQQTTSAILKAMADAVHVWGVQHVVIDNLQFMLGTSERSVDRWWEQDKAVAAFRRFATLNNCHVTLIVHPKKVPEGQLLSIGSIFGGSKVTQEADNILILQVKDSNVVNQSKKALQVVKNRYGGQLGVLPLKFHKESLTLSSHFSQKKEDKEKSSHSTTKTRSKVKGIPFMN